MHSYYSVYHDKTNEVGWGIWNIYQRRGLHTGFWLGKLKERGHLEDLSANGREVVLKQSFKKWDTVHRPEWSGLEYDRVVGYCDWGNDPLVSINCNFSTWRHINFSRRTFCTMKLVTSDFTVFYMFQPTRSLQKNYTIYTKYKMDFYPLSHKISSLEIFSCY